MTGPEAPLVDVAVPRPAGRAHRRRGAAPWVAVAMLVVPLALWSAVAAVAGSSAPLVLAFLLTTPFTLFVAPFVLAMLRRQRGHVRFRRERSGLLLPATTADRVCYALLSAALVAFPFVAAWDTARVGDEQSGFLLLLSWAALPLGAYGFVWLRGWKPTSLRVDAGGVTASANRTTTRLSWEDLPPLDEHGAPRLDRTLRAAGVLFPGYLLRSDPEIVADLLETYRADPGLRPELSSGAAVDRLRRGDLVPASGRVR